NVMRNGTLHAIYPQYLWVKNVFPKKQETQLLQEKLNIIKIQLIRFYNVGADCIRPLLSQVCQ
ncbi:hypothetical protein, partial [Testudinibacter aquarius]